MNNYESMSDFEINKAVSSFVDFGDMVVTCNDSNKTVYLCEKDGLRDMLPVGNFDPCNNPSHAWPIIIKNKINIEFFGERAKACVSIETSFGREFATGYDEDCRPLRAAMICFLKMKDAEK